MSVSQKCRLKIRKLKYTIQFDKLHHVGIPYANAAYPCIHIQYTLSTKKKVSCFLLFFIKHHHLSSLLVCLFVSLFVWIQYTLKRLSWSDPNFMKDRVHDPRSPREGSWIIKKNRLVWICSKIFLISLRISLIISENCLFYSRILLLGDIVVGVVTICELSDKIGVGECRRWGNCCFWKLWPNTLYFYQILFKKDLSNYSPETLL